MKIEWINKSECHLTIDEIEYGMLSFALTTTMEKLSLFNKLHEEFLKGLDERQNVKQIDRKEIK